MLKDSVFHECSGRSGATTERTFKPIIRITAVIIWVGLSELTDGIYAVYETAAKTAVETNLGKPVK